MRSRFFEIVEKPLCEFSQLLCSLFTLVLQPPVVLAQLMHLILEGVSSILFRGQLLLEGVESVVEQPGISSV